MLQIQIELLQFFDMHTEQETERRPQVQSFQNGAKHYQQYVKDKSKEQEKFYKLNMTEMRFYINEIQQWIDLRGPYNEAEKINAQACVKDLEALYQKKKQRIVSLMSIRSCFSGIYLGLIIGFLDRLFSNPQGERNRPWISIAVVTIIWLIIEIISLVRNWRY